MSIQIWHEEFDEFWPKHSKISTIFALMSCFWPNNIRFELKKYRGIMFECTKDWCKIWRKTNLYFLKWQKNLANFHQSTFQSLNIGTFIGSIKCKKVRLYFFILIFSTNPCILYIVFSPCILFNFVEEIVDQEHDLFMGSLGVDSLFTNIPL